MCILGGMGRLRQTILHRGRGDGLRVGHCSGCMWHHRGGRPVGLWGLLLLMVTVPRHHERSCLRSHLREVAHIVRGSGGVWGGGCPGSVRCTSIHRCHGGMLWLKRRQCGLVVLKLVWRYPREVWGVITQSIRLVLRGVHDRETERVTVEAGSLMTEPFEPPQLRSPGD